MGSAVEGRVSKKKVSEDVFIQIEEVHEVLRQSIDQTKRLAEEAEGLVSRARPAAVGTAQPPSLD